MLQLNNPNQALTVRRTIQGRYYRHQATIKSAFLDPNWDRSVPIWPGMAMMRTTGLAYAETAQSFATYTTTVAAGSNGLNVDTFTGTETLLVADTNNLFQTGGTVSVVTSSGTATLAYSGVADGNTLTGVSLMAGSGTLATGAVVSQAADIVSPVTTTQTGFPTGGEGAYTLLNGVGEPGGLCNNYIGGDGIDELMMSGMDSLGVWVLDPDAEVEILAPAFDAVNFSWQTLQSFNGTDVLVYGRTANLTGSAVAGLNGNGGPLGTYGIQGQLVPSTDANASVQPVGRLLAVNGAQSITLGGLMVRV